jgi:nitrogen fixation protein NifX
MPAMLRLAFASDDRATVNQHFGAAVGFAIHAFDGERWQLVELAEFPPETMDGNENKLPAKIATLDGCAAVYCLAVGGSAVKQLLARGVQPMRLDAVEVIDTILAQLRRAIRDGGVPWVDKALKRDGDDGRFDRMIEEGWQE